MTKAPAPNRTRAAAIELQIRAQVERHQVAEQRIPGVMTLAMACEAYASRHTGKIYFESLKAYVAEILQFFGLDTPVTEIDAQRIEAYVRFQKRQPLLVYVGGPKRHDKHKPGRTLWRSVQDGRTRSASTFNHYLNCLRAALGQAAKARDPLTGQSYLPFPPEVPELKAPRRIPRPIRDGDLRRIIEEAPRHLANAVVLTALMGFRRAEVFALTRQQVDFEGSGVWLRAEQTKGGRDEFVLANAPALRLLRQLVCEAEAAGVDHLITYMQGRDGALRPIKSPKSAWRRVMKDLGLQHRFHDLKASYVTALAETEPDFVVMKLARHRNMSTTNRYIDLVDQSKRAGVDALAGRASVAGLDMVQDLGSARSPRQKSPTAEAPRSREKLSA